jgi:hypothetical protein
MHFIIDQFVLSVFVLYFSPIFSFSYFLPLSKHLSNALKELKELKEQGGIMKNEGTDSVKEK